MVITSSGPSMKVASQEKAGRTGTADPAGWLQPAMAGTQPGGTQPRGTARRIDEAWATAAGPQVGSTS